MYVRDERGRCGASSGAFDDLVQALGLAVWAAEHDGGEYPAHDILREARGTVPIIPASYQDIVTHNWVGMVLPDAELYDKKYPPIRMA